MQAIELKVREYYKYDGSYLRKKRSQTLWFYWNSGRTAHWG